ncbi:MAG: hypothetical protein M3Q69_15245 [Acidobacteriota bacterium]|nr:hypothetical protein [Acidobacteriota bacterium]
MKRASVLLVALVVALVVALAASADPRPISDAERAAVTIAADFLARGPQALLASLAPAAPLRALPQADALRELAARTGPREQAKWTLHTVQNSASDVAFRVTFRSGYEDGLLFRMRRVGGRWVVHDVLTLAEEPGGPRTVERPETRRAARTPLLIAAILLAAFAALIRSRLRILSTVCVLLAIAALGLAAMNPIALQRVVAPPAKPLGFVELRDLVPLRNALARGDEPRMPRDLSAEARDVALLWMLQSGAPVTVPGTDADPIGGLASVARTQLAEIVRARIALAHNDEAGARRAFDRALALPPLRDDILLEAAASLDGYRGVERFNGSRDAGLYYDRAMQAAANGSIDQAQQELRTAWMLEPRTREELVREPRLFALLHDVRTMSMVSLLGTSEPLVRSATLSRTPIVLPPNAQSFATGELLRIRIGSATLDVPGGATLAPRSARVVPATFWKHEEDAAALRDAQSLLELPARATKPASRKRVLHAADALANHNRWRDVVTLTEDITPKTDAVSPELLVLRLRALLRSDRSGDARALAAGDAVKQFMQQSSYPATLISIADALANIGDYDTAANLLGGVHAKEYAELASARLRQIDLRRALAQQGIVIQTAHFDIRHDPGMNPAIAARIGDLLEAELARLRTKLGLPEPRRIPVNVLFWEDFRNDITGTDHILGLYDGEILFPFAIVQQFRPEVVSIITHELTHALVAQATSDNAPRWFQEGLAQRMELVPQKENAFHGTAPELVLPLPLLDAAMANGVDPIAVQHGYKVAQTFVRYLEARPQTVNMLITEFAKGRNTDDALSAVTGKSMDELNRDFRVWGFSNSANFVNDEPWPYREFYSPGIDPRIREGVRRSGR